jgi:hypothetical protein
MKQLLPMLLATGLAATLVGCQAATESQDMPSSSSVDSTSDLWVTLKVPNMV